MSLHDPKLESIFQQDKTRLEKTQIPIVTVSGTFAEDLKKWYGLPNENVSTDVVYSRAHFSMAYGAAKSLWSDFPDSNKAWLVDPTNFVSSSRWRNVVMTQEIGKLIARVSVLKTAKDVIDRFGRKKLPILASITPPLLYLFENVHQPILSFHIAAGNILVDLGKTVIQVITDPHVREDYLEHADSPHMHYCVFDEETKFEALEKAFMLGKELDPNRVIVTGPPIDPRIIAARERKRYTPTEPLNILITTGGLGTNKSEIHSILEQLLPTLHKKPRPFRIMLYAGTQKDFYNMAYRLTEDHKVKINLIESLEKQHQHSDNQLNLIYHPQLFDANELLIQYGFPWAHCVISKPSGDMAYDAIAAGCFLLLLKPWGVWEERIEDIFWQKGMARKAETNQIIKQFEALEEIGWMKEAYEGIKNIEPLHLNGVKNIIEAVKSLSN